jgi:hypothetical protein
MKPPRKQRLAVVFALMLTGAATAARAQTTAPGPMALSLDYDGRLYIKVLDFHFDGRLEAQRYRAAVEMRSSGILAAFKHFDIKAHSEGPVEAGLPDRGVFDYINHDGKRVRQVQADWTAEQVRTSSMPAFSNMGEPPANEAQKRSAFDPVLQLVRIMVVQNPRGPCDGEHRFFDGKQLYSLELTPSGTGDLSDRAVRLGLNNPVRCTVTYHEIAGFKRKAPGKRDQGLGQIGVVFAQYGAKGPWLIASMEAPTQLGAAHIDLRDAHMAEAHP